MFCLEYWIDNHLCIYRESEDYLKLLYRYLSLMELLKNSYGPCDRDIYLVKLKNSIDDDEIITEYHR